MTRPDQPHDEGSIADTQMFRRFVEEEQPQSSGTPTWVWVLVVVVMLAIIGVIIALAV